ncbi:choice-of-anchor P family protein [Lentzea sp. NPDC060358]|uniref:choice-of-anchor P family protein n=1 Tax=Lentzea sp. NPDC060358 TaxID=3347103 RepID=UPI003653A7BD
MRFRMTGLAGVVAIAALLAVASPASAAPGDASAYGAKADVTLLGSPAINVGPFAPANVNGPQTQNTTIGVNVPGVLQTGAITTFTSRDDNSGAVYSRASTADLASGLLAPATGNISAGAVVAECSATQQGVVGTTTLTNVNLGSLGQVGATPAPNTKLDVRLLGIKIGEVTFNEQIQNGDGSLTVNAVHIRLLPGVLGSLGSGDVYISSATCGPAALPIPMASGAGLWIGLGLLGAVAVPVAFVVLRRRTSLSAA